MHCGRARMDGGIVVGWNRDEEDIGRALHKREWEHCTMHAVRDEQLHLWTVNVVVFLPAGPERTRAEYRVLSSLHM